MKLVMQYKIQDHGSEDNIATLPLLYESKEKAIYDFKTLVYEAVRKHEESNQSVYSAFVFEGMNLYLGDFRVGKGLIKLPNIMTVDEWFDGIISNNENTN